MTYQPYGAAQDLFDCREQAVLIDGPVGTGKTMAVIYKGLAVADAYPKARILLVRKTRKSLTESVLVTLEEKILPQNCGIKLHGGSRAHRSMYELPNGSVLVCGGMDPGSGVNNRASVMSTEWDMILVFEATEFTEDDIEKLGTRLRNFQLPYQQIVMDCNPGPPTHFLIRGAHEKKWNRFASRHADNPFLWDGKDWTKEGAIYMRRLDGMTGHRRARLRDGIWAASEGNVYPEFDAAVHVIDPFPIPPSWRRFRSIDFGYTNAFCCGWWAVDGDGRMYLYREIYHTKRIVSDHAKTIKEQEAKAGDTVREAVSDHDAEDRATLDRENIGTVAARKEVSVGIQAVANRLRIAGDGKPRIFFVRDTLVERDILLSEAKKPCCTVEEFDGYLWTKAPDGKPIKEEPIKVDDHGMDQTRYAVMHLDHGEMVGGGVVIHGSKPPTKMDPKQVTCVCGNVFDTDDPRRRFCSVRCEMNEKRKDPNFGFGGRR